MIPRKLDKALDEVRKLVDNMQKAGLHTEFSSGMFSGLNTAIVTIIKYFEPKPRKKKK